MKNITKFFIDIKMPYLECRYSNSTKNYKTHIHNNFSIGAIKQGKRSFIFKNSEEIICPDMLAIINANEIHSCNSIDIDTRSEYYMLYLDNDWCLEIQSSIFKDIDKLQNFPMHLIKNKQFFDEYILVCELLFSNEFHLKKEELLIQFISKLFIEYFNLSTLQTQNTKLKNIISYMNDNIHLNINLEEISKEFNINKYHLIRTFNKEYGLSAHAYFLNLKINKAKELLRKGYSLVDTALELGFSDQSHFHKNFTKIVAATPREYQIKS